MKEKESAALEPKVFASHFMMAPMAGVTDEPFRARLRRWGCRALWTEMVSAAALVRKHKKTHQMAAPGDLGNDTAIQLFGANPDELLPAAEILTALGWLRIDFNMGCPVKKVTKSGAGAALLGDLSLAAKCIKAVRDGSGGIFTVKIRSGVTSSQLNYLEAGKMAEGEGADGVVLHARTRAQGYSGFADWSQIDALAGTLGIPVAGNGDIDSAKTALDRLSGHPVAAVMIGRAALASPWIFRDVELMFQGGAPLGRPSIQERSADLSRHFAELVEFKGERGAVGEIKKFAAWCIKGVQGGSVARAEVMQIKEADAMCEFIASLAAFDPREGGGS